MKTKIKYFIIPILLIFSIFDCIGQDRKLILKSPSKHKDVKNIYMSLCDICPKKSCLNCDILGAKNKFVFSNGKRKSKGVIQKNKEYLIIVEYSDGSKKKYLIDDSRRRKTKIKID